MLDTQRTYSYKLLHTSNCHILPDRMNFWEICLSTTKIMSVSYNWTFACLQTFYTKHKTVISFLFISCFTIVFLRINVSMFTTNNLLLTHQYVFLFYPVLTSTCNASIICFVFWPNISIYDTWFIPTELMGEANYTNNCTLGQILICDRRNKGKHL